MDPARREETAGGENVLKICLQTSRGRDLFEAVELMEHFAFPSTGFEPRTILATPSLADYVQRLDSMLSSF